ncbi:MAG: TIGR02328 family protein [Bacillota bacterium]|nr:TIGR02328 family protein [Bacillota bacterium]
MRLWHEELIKHLPRQQLLGQHRECCALRGKGWKKPHSTVNYIFNYSIMRLVAYHLVVMNEMKNRGYQVAEEWLDPSYCGKILGYINVSNENKVKVYELYKKGHIYKEHDDQYLEECLENLRGKNINIRGLTPDTLKR